LPRLTRLCFALTIVYWCALFIATHIPAERLPYVPVTDKTVHFVSYGVLALALFVSLSVARGRAQAELAVTVLGVCLAYGAVDEWLQIPVHRSCELADWYADVAGAATAVVLATLVTRWNRV
jgi:VanZ family protein